MKYNKIQITLVCMFVIVLFSGCFNRPKHTEIKVSFANHTWNRFEPMDATFDIDKTDKTYEVAVYLGVIDGFELDNVPLEIVITSPSGQKNILDRTVIVKKDGNYLGKAYGDVWTTRQIVYPAKQFSHAGTYAVSIQNRTQYYDLYNTESLTFIVRPVKK